MNDLTRRAVIPPIGSVLGWLKVGAAKAAAPVADKKLSSEASHWFKLNLASSRYLSVPSTLNGQPVPAIIDTGATRSIINPAWAKKLGLPEIGMFQALSMTREVQGTLHLASTLSVGDVALHDAQIGSLDVSEIEHSISHEIPLIIGQDLLAKAVLELQFANDRGRVATAVEPSQYARFGRLPLDITSGGLCSIPIEIEGRRVDAILDLGSNVLCSMSSDYARENGLLMGRRTSTVMTVGAEGASVNQTLSLRDVVIGRFSVGNVPASIVEDWKLTQPVNLGWPFFVLFDFLLELKVASLWLYAAEDHLAQALPRDRSGIGASRLPDRLLVRHVGKNSPAEKAGLRSGDEIVAIDGRSIDPTYPPAGQRQGYGPEGTRISMTLADGRNLSIVLENYF